LKGLAALSSLRSVEEFLVSGLRFLVPFDVRYSMFKGSCFVPRSDGSIACGVQGSIACGVQGSIACGVPASFLAVRVQLPAAFLLRSSQ
jgi:hypothetical protein